MSNRVGIKLQLYVETSTIEAECRGLVHMMQIVKQAGRRVNNIDPVPSPNYHKHQHRKNDQQNGTLDRASYALLLGSQWVFTDYLDRSYLALLIFCGGYKNFRCYSHCHS